MLHRGSLRSAVQLDKPAGMPFDRSFYEFAIHSVSASMRQCRVIRFHLHEKARAVHYPEFRKANRVVIAARNVPKTAAGSSFRKPLPFNEDRLFQQDRCFGNEAAKRLGFGIQRADAARHSPGRPLNHWPFENSRANCKSSAKSSSEKGRSTWR